jgi:hypothetical protein
MENDTDRIVQFNDFSNISILGCSSSGKSTLLLRILKNKDRLFSTPPNKVIYIYSIWQELYEQMNREVSNITFINHIPSEDEILSYTENVDHTIICIDDMMREVLSTQVMSDMSTKLCHHCKITCIITSQDSAHQGKYKSSITKNTHYTILMNSPREMCTIRSLGTQMGDYKNLMSAYKDAMTMQDYGYLLIDCHPRSNRKFRYRTNILPNELCIIYQYT